MDIKFVSEFDELHLFLQKSLSGLQDDYYAITVLHGKLHNLEPFPKESEKVIDNLLDYVYNQAIREIEGDSPVYDLTFEKELFDIYLYILGLRYEEEVDEDINFYFVYKFRDSIIFLSILQFGSPKDSLLFENNSQVCNLWSDLRRND